MGFLDYGLMILMVCTCAFAIYSDLKEGMIYNKMLIAFLAPGLCIDIIYYGTNRKELIDFVINIIVVVFICIVLFWSHSFAGGDTKMVIVLAILYPARFYLRYANNECTLYMAIGLAIIFGYVYLLVDSFVSLISGKNKFCSAYIKMYLKSFFKSFIYAMLYISLLNVLLAQISAVIHIQLNIWIVRIICICVAWSIGRFQWLKNRIVLISVLIIEVLICLVLHIIPVSLYLDNYLLVILLLLCRMMISTCLYEEIPIENLEKGMILSTASSLVMQNSRIRGLPSISSEDLRNRMTKEEVNSVQRWAKNNQILTITIVKKIPFAVFLTLGYLGYFILWRLI